jgi:transcriptional regulator with XRE-family HTH domain
MTLDQFLKGRSHTDFAEAAKITPTSLWRIRKGKQRPSFATIENLVEASNGAVQPNDILAISADSAAA